MVSPFLKRRRKITAALPSLGERRQPQSPAHVKAGSGWRWSR